MINHTAGCSEVSNKALAEWSENGIENAIITTIAGRRGTGTMTEVTDDIQDSMMTMTKADEIEEIDIHPPPDE